MDCRVYLKVKIKSLAEEARIIRKETKKTKSTSLKDGLYRHRVDVVRYEARHTHLAYGFLRGKEYRQLEQKARETPNWSRVRKMVSKYGIHEGYSWGEWVKAQNDRDALLKRFDEWVTKATTEVIV